MSAVDSDTDVLVVGAGPTGLVLALWLARLGVRVLVIDKTAEPGTTSRALAVHARILEHYRQLGLADKVVERGLPFAAVNLWVASRKVGRAPFGIMGTGVSPFPYALIFAQDEHERLLIEELQELGVHVERHTELVAFEQSVDGVRATLRMPDSSERTCKASYIAGCDGAHSKVREILGSDFPGGTYAHVFYVADVEASGPVMDHELHVALDRSDFLAVFPLKTSGRARLIGTVRPGSEHRGDVSWNDVSKTIVERMRISVDRVNWFSTYHVHHRVARCFRDARAFLLGDAAHIHSPVGGQGMNTGIGDATNLAWKLAAVLHGCADAALLDSYEPERTAFAHRLVATTDRVFTFATRDGAIARFVRLSVVPRVVPAVLAQESARRFMFRTLSQTAISYRRCDFNAGTAGKVHGGDRLPWIEHADDRGDNFAPLAVLDWQVHIYGEPIDDIATLCAERELPLHRFGWRPEMERKGLAPNALYLLRPDGYVALADAHARVATLRSFLDERRLQPLARRTLPAETLAAAHSTREPGAVDAATH